MTIPSIDRCDAGLSNGRRCQNQAQYWIHFADSFTPNVEWPVAVCELHREPKGKGFHRLGPNRKRQYAELHRESPDPAL